MKQVLNYLQLVWGDTYLVGCGYSFYYDPARGYTKNYVCNYGPRWEFYFPYFLWPIAFIRYLSANFQQARPRKKTLLKFEIWFGLFSPLRLLSINNKANPSPIFDFYVTMYSDSRSKNYDRWKQYHKQQSMPWIIVEWKLIGSTRKITFVEAGSH